ncbi:hypothetical protein BS35_000737 [Actinomadura glauciflava]|nr:hypothetical protein [Actinomadura glauciflava]
MRPSLLQPPKPPPPPHPSPRSTPQNPEERRQHPARLRAARPPARASRQASHAQQHHSPTQAPGPPAPRATRTTTAAPQEPDRKRAEPQGRQAQRATRTHNRRTITQPRNHATRRGMAVAPSAGFELARTPARASRQASNAQQHHSPTQARGPPGPKGDPDHHGRAGLSRRRNHATSEGMAIASNGRFERSKNLIAQRAARRAGAMPAIASVYRRWRAARPEGGEKRNKTEPASPWRWGAGSATYGWRAYRGTTWSACGPRLPCVTSNWTRWFSSRLR